MFRIEYKMKTNMTMLFIFFPLFAQHEGNIAGSKYHLSSSTTLKEINITTFLINRGHFLNRTSNHFQIYIFFRDISCFLQLEKFNSEYLKRHHKYRINFTNVSYRKKTKVSTMLLSLIYGL